MKLVRKELRLNALKLTNTRTSKDNDDLLITEHGAEVLTSSILKEIDDIERFYSNR